MNLQLQKRNKVKQIRKVILQHIQKLKLQASILTTLTLQRTLEELGELHEQCETNYLRTSASFLQSAGFDLNPGDLSVSDEEGIPQTGNPMDQEGSEAG